MIQLQVIKKTNYGIQSMGLDSMLLDRRMVFLTGPITTESVSLIVKQLLFLENADACEPVCLIIDSPGGEVQAGLYLYDQLKGMDIPLELYCTELAASMAAIILAGGRRGHRHILKHSKVMIHEPLISASSGGLYGSASSLTKSCESILETKRILVELLAENTGRSFEEVEQEMAFDHFMNADEAVAFGICDQIVSRI